MRGHARLIQVSSGGAGVSRATSPMQDSVSSRIEQPDRNRPVADRSVDGHTPIQNFAAIAAQSLPFTARATDGPHVPSAGSLHAVADDYVV